MKYSTNDGAEWFVIAIIAFGVIFAFIWVHTWWLDRFGYDPFDGWKRK